MGETEWWEEAIDVDDSDLGSLLHPLPLSSSSSNPTVPLSLPSLQPCAQISRPSQTLASNPPTPPASSQLRPQSLVPDEQEEERVVPPREIAVRRRIPGPAGAVQAAMHRESVAAAAQKSRVSAHPEEEGREDRRAEIDDGDGDFKLNPWLYAMAFLGLGADFAVPSPISSITTRGSIDRVPQVVGIVKSCAPNGLGDLFVTLKDPTGTVSASVHRKVLAESNLGGDISVGCILILKQVVVFSPAHSARYLNVTVNNVVKLISKDCGPPHKQTLPQFTARCGDSGECTKIMLGEAKGPPLLRQGADSNADDEVRRNSNSQMLIDRRKPEGLPRSLVCSISSTAATSNMVAKTNLKTSEPKKLISKDSVAQWTDEQLLELFSDY